MRGLMLTMLVGIVSVVAGCGGGSGSKIEKHLRLSSGGHTEWTCRSAGTVAFGEGKIPGYECYDSTDTSLEHQSSRACYTIVDGEVEHIVAGRCR